MTFPLTQTFLQELPGNPLAGLAQADRVWGELRRAIAAEVEDPTLVQSQGAAMGEVLSDVIICGATLGVIVGLALVRRGWRVVLVERGTLRGRDQEWNISRRELAVLLELGLLELEELEAAIASEYNPARIAFVGSPDWWVRDVLNLGVSPRQLLATFKQKFLAAGGVLLEQTAVERVQVHPDGVSVRAGEHTLTGRILLDMMGHFSAIARQARRGAKPDGICLVVGSCAQGYAPNSSGDLMVSFTPIQNHCQFFWEAFPAAQGRTTYLFTYLDAEPDRPSLAWLLEEYLRLLPEYQQVDFDALQFERILFGVLPSYRQSPLQPAWDRILQVGDSSGSQSPLSFGGFGALLRHLERLVRGIDEALRADCLGRQDLALLHPYQPNLAVTWLFQRAMSVAVDQTLPPEQINRLLGTVFAAMAEAGEVTLKPFLQDVVQFSGLTQSLVSTGLRSPQTVAAVIPQVGVRALLDWSRHYAGLGGYAMLQAIAAVRPARPMSSASASASLLELQQVYRWQRRLDAWRYGSGADY